MEITWYGLSCFRITERNMATVVVDPYDHNEAGHKELKLKADIVTVSHEAAGHNFVKAVKGNKWLITGPGEYEIGGVFITAVPTDDETAQDAHRNLAVVLDYDSVKVAHLGDIRSVPSRKQVEAFGNVDVLLVPVGGGGSLSAAKAAETISLIEPGIVIPMHYKLKDTKLSIEPVAAFLKQMGLGNQPESLPSYKVNSKAIPEETKVILLESQA